MELTTDQIAFIAQDIQERGITMDELTEDLVDHICCVIENGSNADFHSAYHEALETFGKNGFRKIQNETNVLLTLKREIIMKKTMYSLGYIAACLSTTGLLFKLQHWPGAAIMLTVGIVLLNFGFLPIYFYSWYKRTTN